MVERFFGEIASVCRARSALLGAGTEAPTPRIVLAFDESQEVGVDRLGLGRDHAVGKVFVGFHSAVLQELRRQRSGGDIRDDLVIFAVHDQCWDRDLLQILGKVSLGKSHNAIICLLYTSPSPRDRQKSRMPSSA